MAQVKWPALRRGAGALQRLALDVDRAELVHRGICGLRLRRGGQRTAQAGAQQGNGRPAEQRQGRKRKTTHGS